jgi:orotidine-5'-phosphate decarboxylase
MQSRNFRELVENKSREGKFLCVGLDPDVSKIPAHVLAGSLEDGIVAFHRRIVDATRDIAGAYKPNAAFYEAHGEAGWRALKSTISLIIELAPDVPIILDAKRADIGNTNNGYVISAFDDLKADAITVHPYLGSEALEPFLARKEKGIIVLCRTSNKGAAEFQDLTVEGVPLYQRVAGQVVSTWNGGGNCGLVVGATYPQELSIVRSLAPELPILIPGVGAQGGDLEASVRAGRDARNGGFWIAASRAILYESAGVDFVEAARTKAHEYDGAIRTALLESR